MSFAYKARSGLPILAAAQPLLYRTLVNFVYEVDVVYKARNQPSRLQRFAACTVACSE